MNSVWPSLWPFIDWGMVSRIGLAVNTGITAELDLLCSIGITFGSNRPFRVMCSSIQAVILEQFMRHRDISNATECYSLLLTLISTPGVHADPRHIFCAIFYDRFVIFSPYFRYSSPFHMSSLWLNITYLGMAQKPAHNILRWGPRGPQAHQYWNTTHTWVSLYTRWRFLFGNGSPV